MAKSVVMQATSRGCSGEMGRVVWWASLAWCFWMLEGVIQPSASDSESSLGGGTALVASVDAENAVGSRGSCLVSSEMCKEVTASEQSVVSRVESGASETS